MSDFRVGLDTIGIQDQAYLKNALLNCEDPLKAISEFQEQNSIMLPTLKPALPLLDLHNVKRLDFHQSIADNLKERLMKRIEELANSKEADSISKLEELLDKSFLVINVPRLTQLVLSIMKHLPSININYLNFIQNHNEFYSIAPVEVKRHIWLPNQDLFYKELSPILDKCISHFDEQLLNFDANTKGTIETPADKDSIGMLKYKRHSPHINEIVKMIGNNGKLYMHAVTYLTKLFLATRNWIYATIRSLMLMKLHDVDIVDVSSSENIYKFTWTLNACIKERKIESKKVKELEAIIDAKKFDKIFKDVAFILADYFAIDTFAHSVLIHLTRCVQNEVLPRNCSELVFTFRLLSMSLSAWTFLADDDIIKEPKPDTTIIINFLPNLMYLIADQQERLYEESINNLNAPETSDFLSPTISKDSPSRNATTKSGASLSSKCPDFKISTDKNEIIDSIKVYHDSHEICHILVFYYILECVEIADWINLKHISLILDSSETTSYESFDKWFLSQFINASFDFIDLFKHEWFATLFFNEFLIKYFRDDVFFEQLYRYLDKLQSYLPINTYNYLLEELKPRKTTSINLQQFYNQKLKAKLEVHLSASNLQKSTKS